MNSMYWGFLRAQVLADMYAHWALQPENWLQEFTAHVGLQVQPVYLNRTHLYYVFPASSHIVTDTEGVARPEQLGTRFYFQYADSNLVIAYDPELAGLDELGALLKSSQFAEPYYPLAWQGSIGLAVKLFFLGLRIQGSEAVAHDPTSLVKAIWTRHPQVARAVVAVWKGGRIRKELPELLGLCPCSFTDAVIDAVSLYSTGSSVT